MARTLLLLFLVVALSTFTASPAFAVLNQDPGTGSDCDSSDSCMHEGDWWYTSYTGGTPYTSCGLSGGCQTCGDNGHGKQVCVYHVTFSALCSCSNVQRAGAGPGITDCSASGQCDVRLN